MLRPRPPQAPASSTAGPPSPAGFVRRGSPSPPPVRGEGARPDAQGTAEEREGEPLSAPGIERRSDRQQHGNQHQHNFLHPFDGGCGKIQEGRGSGPPPAPFSVSAFGAFSRPASSSVFPSSCSAIPDRRAGDSGLPPRLEEAVSFPHPPSPPPFLMLIY